MESKNKRFLDYSIKQIPVELDQAIERYRSETYIQSGTKITKNQVLTNALELGLKSMGILE